MQMLPREPRELILILGHLGRTLGANKLTSRSGRRIALVETQCLLGSDYLLSCNSSSHSYSLVSPQDGLILSHYAGHNGEDGLNEYPYFLITCSLLFFPSAEMVHLHDLGREVVVMVTGQGEMVLNGGGIGGSFIN